jgi:2'-hydroxyisoflavone reductase
VGRGAGRVALVRVLIVGGSRFVGRHLTEVLSGRHEVWLANRGQTSTELFGAVGRFDVDRSRGGDLSALAGQAFDAVVDVSAYVPAQVRGLAEALAGAGVGRYLLISTVSVYDPAGAAADATEGAATTAPVRDTEEVTPETYGGLKVACEEDAAAAWGDRLTVVRPGIVAGPHDHTDRLTWWPRFLGLSTPTPLPDQRAQPVQSIDARDLALFCRRLLEDGTPGTFDATGDPMDLASLADEVVAVVGAAWAGGATGPQWVPTDRWGDVPLPPLFLGDPVDWPMFARDSARAVEAGLVRRPLRETITDLVAWDVERGQPPLAAPPSAEQVLELRARLSG